MAVVKEICSRVAVMEHGKVAEEGEVFSIFAAPKQPITQSFIKTTRLTCKRSRSSSPPTPP